MSSDYPEHSFDSHTVLVLSKPMELLQRLPERRAGANGEERPCVTMSWMLRVLQNRLPGASLFM